jgi:two-component system chemotaxis sensor kinase CheA
MSFDPAIESYLVESRELLDVMEQSLLGLEAGSNDPDLINAIFRAAHTIKGTGGIFGFDPIVVFTHQVESVLDKLRDGVIKVDSDLVALLLRCCDHIRLKLGPVTRGEELDKDLLKEGEELIDRLKRYLKQSDDGSTAKTQSPSSQKKGLQERISIDKDEAVSATGLWHISLRFGREVLRNGMDPLSFLRYLTRLGDIVDLTTLTDTMPSAEEIDPESCYLGFEISFKSEAEKEEIESAFEFVRDDCKIRILPPRSKVSEYLLLIQELPEDSMLLGEILVKSKALTQAELDEGLSLQSKQIDQDDRPGDAIPHLLGEILVKEGTVDANVVSAALDKQQQVKERKTQEKRYIRIDSDKLEMLINLVGELVIAGANTQLTARQAGVSSVIESAANLARLVEEVRNIALSLQMVQIGNTFQRFQRVVHDVSKELGKEIELAISGGDTELDKSVVEQINDPLMHLVRNAMDHGIEPVEIRLAEGKPSRGMVGLNAYHDSGSIVIEVSDDGKGLDRDKIFNKAVARGLITSTQNLSDDDIYNLIFEPGFSMADQVSNLSGRGVGMDVVRRNVESLRGSVQVESAKGVGTVVRIRLPLTLAIIDGFLVGVGPERYVIPMDMLVECLEHSGHERELAQKQGYLNVRGDVLPVIRLGDFFGIKQSSRRRENVAVVRFGSQRAGLIVDDLLGEFQTVIKPLGTLFSHLTAISGSTILGSGEVALIIDVPGFLRHVMARGAQSSSVPVSSSSALSMSLQHGSTTPA